MDVASDEAATAGNSVDAREAAHFGALAADWWDPKGSSAMLHRLNPVRLRYIRAAIDRHWGGDPLGFAPLTGRTALDVGCGAGLLAEPLVRMGAQVSGIDAAPENIAAARHHAAQSGLTIDYRTGGIEARMDARFDLVTCLEVIEHVVDQPSFVAHLCDAVADGGMLVISTPNRTTASRAAMIALAEGSGMIPRGTHDWHRFVTPEELSTMLEGEGFVTRDVRGIVPSPATGFALGDSTWLNYIVTATRRS